MTPDIDLSGFELTIAGRTVDGRTIEAKRFRTLASDLAVQLGRGLTARC